MHFLCEPEQVGSANVTLSFTVNSPLIIHKTDRQTDTHLAASFAGQRGKPAPERLNQCGF